MKNEPWDNEESHAGTEPRLISPFPIFRSSFFIFPSFFLCVSSLGVLGVSVVR
jgi:hypothetical protein